jgi:ABC-2 type transport system ATP-binding protein
MTPAPAVAMRGLRKNYGPLRALDGVDLEIEPGEVFGLLGPNGAGKTTMIEILEGYRQRSAGDLSVLGVDPAAGDRAWRARLGIVLQSTAVFDALTVEELITHFALFYPDPLPVGQVIEMAGLQEKRRARCAKLSGGQKRRVDLALGLVGNPDLIFLDEPTTGFDPAARRQAWDVVRGLTSLGKTILLTTHYLDEAEQLARRVGVIIAGRLAEVGPPDQIGGRARAQVHISFALPPALGGRALPELPGQLTRDGDELRLVTATPTAALRELLAWAKSAGLDELPGLTVGRPSLEDVYLDMIQAAGAAGTRRGGE